MQRRLALALALACAVPAAAWADFRADFATVKGSGSPGLARIELSGQKLRTDGGNVTMLFDGDSGKKILLMHDKHQYIDMEKVVQTAGAAMARANAALAKLPPEQRAMIEKQMGGHMPGAEAPAVVMQVTPTGASDRVAGYACQIYRTEVDGRHTQDSCLADAAGAGISATDRAAVQHAFEQMKAFSEKMIGGSYKSPIVDIPADKFPVQVTRYDDAGQAIHVSQLKQLTSASIDAGDFAIPAGYREQEISGPGRRH